MSKIIYVSPNTEVEYDELIEKKKNNTLYECALEDDDMYIYDTIEDFVTAFNGGYISDEGYLFEV